MFQKHLKLKLHWNLPYYRKRTIIKKGLLFRLNLKCFSFNVETIKQQCLSKTHSIVVLSWILAVQFCFWSCKITQTHLKSFYLLQSELVCTDLTWFCLWFLSRRSVCWTAQTFFFCVFLPIKLFVWSCLMYWLCVWFHWRKWCWYTTTVDMSLQVNTFWRHRYLSGGCLKSWVHIFHLQERQIKLKYIGRHTGIIMGYSSGLVLHFNKISRLKKYLY